MTQPVAGKPHRRAVLKAGVLGLVAFAAAACASSLRTIGGGSSPSAPAPTPAPTLAPVTPPPTVAPTSAPTAAPATAAPGTAGPVIGNLADFAGVGARPFTIPYEVPYAMNPGGPGIMVRLADGSVVAYSASCTHGRCTVGWDETTQIIQCPCHTARFDPANQAAVLSGPAPTPLTSIPLAVAASGEVRVVLQAG